MPTIIVSHVYPPIPTRSHDWCAYFDGAEEEGKCGWGATKSAAIADLMQHACDSDEQHAVCLAALRADLEAAQQQWADAGWPAAYINIARIAYERAIQTVEALS